MKMKDLLHYLSYGVLAVLFSLLQKIFAALSKKCSTFTDKSERLLLSTRAKIQTIKTRKNGE